MLNTFRIIIAGTLLFGSAVLNSSAHAVSLSRELPRAAHPVKADPYNGAWPYIVRSCLA